jgi:hypothetical protein
VVGFEVLETEMWCSVGFLNFWGKDSVTVTGERELRRREGRREAEEIWDEQRGGGMGRR